LGAVCGFKSECKFEALRRNKLNYMRKLFFIIILLFPVTLFAQKKKTIKCDSITCDYVIKITVTYPDSVITGDCIKMMKGEIVMVLYDKTPKHKSNFIKLAKEGFFNGTTFHRVINGFMIQGGDPNSKDTDPNNDGLGGPGYTIPSEFVSELKHKRGALAAARMGDQMNPKRESSGSQFYIVQSPKGTPQLDGAYTVFGEVLKGMEIVDRISKQAKLMNDRPVYDVKMTVTVEQMPKTKITELYGYKY
jgi:cyclophilin family peptidyl-prolyl cis-trans isomerase